MHKLLIVLFFVTISFACVKHSESGNSVVISSNQDSDKKIDSNEEPIITAEESGSMCNFCSSYKISVLANGKVNLESQRFVENNSNQGEKFIKETKVSNKQLSKEQLQSLINDFENINFFELADSYGTNINCPKNWTDATTIHLFYKNEKQSKTVHYYRGCEGNEDLVKLAKLREVLNKKFGVDNLLNRNIMANTNVGK